MSSFRGLSEVIGAQELICALYTDGGGHYWHTPEAGGKVDRNNPTQVRRALIQLGIELIPAYSPEARGHSERVFGTLENRLPQELRLRGITAMVAANRFLAETFLPAHNQRFTITAGEPGGSFVPLAGNLQATSSAFKRTGPPARTTPCAKRVWSCRSQRTGIVTTTSKLVSRGCINSPAAVLLSSTARPVDKWTTAMRLTTSLQAQKQQKRSIDMVHKAINLKCYRR